MPVQGTGQDVQYTCMWLAVFVSQCFIYITKINISAIEKVYRWLPSNLTRLCGMNKAVWNEQVFNQLINAFLFSL